MSFRNLAAAAAAIAASLPVAVAGATPGNGHGNANGHANGHAGVEHGNGHGNANGHGPGDATESTDVASPGAHVPGPPRAGSRNYVARGVVATVDAADGLVGITITAGPGGTNRAALAWRGQTVQFNASSAFLSLDDTNGDQVIDLTDLTVGARVQVQAFLLANDAQPYPARRLTSHAAVAPTTTTTPTDTTTTAGDTSASS